MRENEIANEMKLHFPWKPSERLSDVKIGLFIKVLQGVCQ
jgi:hypothetical protein